MSHSAREWIHFFRSRGVDPALVQVYAAYIKPLIRRGLPVIFDREHLAALLGRTPYFMGIAINASECLYRKFQIPKRSGGRREIAAPYPLLLECQRWVVNEILARVAVHPASMAYVRGRSIKTNATAHVAPSVAIIAIDIKDFFPSITLARVIGLFRSFGYTKEVSLCLAKLCCLGGRLPQGAASSPAISNLLCRGMDARLAGVANRFGLTYTRYADDLAFSSRTRVPVDRLIRLVGDIVRESGFEVNPGKTRYFRPSVNRKLVTGLNVANGSVQVPRSFKREIRSEVHFIRRHGVLSHLAKRKIRDPLYIRRLVGKAGYWAFIEEHEGSEAGEAKQAELFLRSVMRDLEE